MTEPWLDRINEQRMKIVEEVLQSRIKSDKELIEIINEISKRWKAPIKDLE